MTVTGCRNNCLVHAQWRNKADHDDTTFIDTQTDVLDRFVGGLREQ